MWPNWTTTKEIVERRHREPIEFLFLPESFWAAKPSMKKKLWLWIMSFMGWKLIWYFLYMIKSKKKTYKILEAIFGVDFFSYGYSCFGYYSKGCLPLLISTGFLKYSLELKKKFQWELKKKFSDRIVASTSPSRIKAHAGLFRSLMKGIFDPYVLWPFDKKLNF